MQTETRQALLLTQSGGTPQLVDLLVTITNHVNGKRIMTPHPELLMHMLDSTSGSSVCKSLVSAFLFIVDIQN
jgi:hypothetical protein